MKDQSKIIVLLVALVLLIGGGIALWKFDVITTPSTSTSSLVAAPPLHDFGEISMARGNVLKVFTLSNDGEEALTITSIKTSCICTKATVDGVTFSMDNNPTTTFTLSPGETKKMLVVFDPNAHGPDATGPIARIVSVTTNSATTPLVEVRVQGLVIK